jgi:hypothetical protein
MSAMRRSLVALVLLAMAAVSATAAADQNRGIWVYPSGVAAWTLTVVNLTDQPLSLTNSVSTTPAQRPPFHGIPACNDVHHDYLCVPVEPYRNVTWKSNTATLLYPHPRWNGTLAVLPQGMDPKWTVTLNFKEYDFPNAANWGTWAYVTVDFFGNDGWLDFDPDNPSCGYLDSYTSMYNVMKLSGTDLVAVLYAPYVAVYGAPTVDVTLIIQKRGLYTESSGDYGFYEDPRVAPCLTYQDNNGYGFGE